MPLINGLIMLGMMVAVVMVFGGEILLAKDKEIKKLKSSQQTKRYVDYTIEDNGDIVYK